LIAPSDAGSRRPEGGGDDGSSHDWKKSLPLLRALLEDLKGYAVILLDRTGCVMTWSSGARELKGYREEEILGAHVSKFYTSEGVAAGLPQIELDTATAAGRFEDEGWRLRKDGSRFWANVVVTALHDEQGALWGFLKITRDLTERRGREQETRESEERFRLLVEGVRDYAIFTLDPRGHVTTWNAGARHIKGYEPHEIIGSHFSRFYPPDAIARQWPEYELRVATLEGRFEDEGWRLRKDGSRFWANVVITALRDAEGQLRGFSKITRDLTERRKQEESLRRSEERFRLLVEGVRDHALFMTDARGFITSWNFGAERTTGHQAAQIIGKHLANFYRVDEVGADQPWRDLACARRTGRLEVEGWRLRQDGSSYWAKAIVSSLTDSHGEFCGYAHLLQDLTQQRHAQQLEDVSVRMNEFIALLAHELRNPLAPIRNAVMLMQRKGLGDPVLESMRETIERQCMALDRILNELLDVSRIARGELRLEMRPIDLNQVVTRAIEVSRPHIERHGHELAVQLPERPLPFLADALRLNQVIVNLLNNAAKYTPAGGKLWLSLVQHADRIELRVRDTGIGIPPESLGRVFDLFYQGREVLPLAEGGLGVGLALVRRVAELHGGGASVSSEGLDKGSEFIVTLPSTALLANASAAAAVAPQQPEPALPRHRVLVAEDNRDAAMTFEVLLQTLGQETYVVHDGAAALEAFTRFRPQILMLDIGMPKLNGYEVARRIRRLAGAAVVLVAVTGWGQDVDRERAREAGFDHHFVKPLSEAALRKVLSAEPPV
jgi:PAS domain S-box-containing protein